MTEKDRKALAIGNKMGVRHVALSFANRASDVDEVRALVGRDTMITSKIECLNGLHNLPEITEKSDALLIDRGDLSRQVNIEKIPAMQKDIIRHAKVGGKRQSVRCRRGDAGG
jgi:pyruvate kinase